MSATDFLEPSTKQKVVEAITEVEAQTAAEVVVAVRKSSGMYRHADLICGAIFALIGLLIFLFHPAPFDEDLFPLAQIAFFLTGTFFCSITAPVRRFFSRRSLLRENTKVASRSAFYDMGISRTKDRTGILIFVSLFEQQAEIVQDLGVDLSTLDPEWATAVEMIQGAVRKGDIEQFVAGIKRMGSPLGKQLPRSEDDVNELSDEVQ